MSPPVRVLECMLGTGSNADRAKVSRVLVGSSTSPAFSGSTTTKSSCLSGDLRAWTSHAISAATGKESDSIYRKVSRSRGAITSSKLGRGAIPWSWVLLPFYRKNIRQVYTVWCSRLHNRTISLLITKLRKKLRSRPSDPQWLSHES